MRRIKEALRLRYACGLGIRQVARSLGLSHSTVSELLQRAAAAGLTWPLPEDLDEAALEAKLYPGNPRGSLTGLPRTGARSTLSSAARV